MCVYMKKGDLAEGIRVIAEYYIHPNRVNMCVVMRIGIYIPIVKFLENSL